MKAQATIEAAGNVKTTPMSMIQALTVTGGVLPG